ncbi:MAG: chemotaxis protein CheX [Desulfobacterales bacterium]|nr:chemotaxis protein CheX [Desulfobacterales bacterium]
MDIAPTFLVAPEEIAVGGFRGIIGISGERKGFVFVSAPRTMLRHLVLRLGEKEADDALIQDVIGEEANTISGNAPRMFGPGFMISVPLIVEGPPQRIGIQRDEDIMAYVIPVRWNTFPFQPGVSLT